MTFIEPTDFENEKSAENNAEHLIKDELIQEGLRSVLVELDDLSSNLKLKEKAKVRPIVPGVLPDGTFIAATELYPRKDSDENRPNSSDAEYLIFMFNLTELKDPDFKLTPRVYDHDTVIVKRGSGIGVELIDEDGGKTKAINLPQMSDELTFEDDPYRVVDQTDPDFKETESTNLQTLCYKTGVELFKSSRNAPPSEEIVSNEALPVIEAGPLQPLERRRSLMSRLGIKRTHN